MNDAGRIGFVIKGVYNNTETYDFLDVVYYNNSSYVAKKLTVGNPPADNNEYWQALAKVPISAVLGVKGNAESTYRTGNVNLTAENIGLGKVNNTADANKNVATANQVNGTYTGSGGQQSPSYVTSGKTRFNMMTSFKGFTNPAGGYMDVILMDNYNGGDVPYVTGIGVTKNNGNPRMFIANGEKGSTGNWAHQVEVITSSNISSQNIASSTKATQDGNGNVIADTYAKKEWTEEPIIQPGETNAYRNGSGVVDMIIMLCNHSSELFVYNTFFIPNPYERCGEGRSGMYLYLDKEHTEYVYMRRGSSAIVFDNKTSNTLKIFTKK